jgi:hypothetical protein
LSIAATFDVSANLTWFSGIYDTALTRSLSTGVARLWWRSWFVCYRFQWLTIPLWIVEVLVCLVEIIYGKIVFAF